MRARNYLFWVALGFSGISALIVLGELLIAFVNLGVPVAWRGQLIALDVAFLLLSVFQFVFFRERITLHALFFMRLILFMVATYPLGASSTARTVLLSALAFEAAIYLPAASGIAVAVIAILFSLFWSISPQASGDGLFQISFEKTLAILFYPTLVTALGAILTRLQKLATERENLNVQLRTASARLVETNIRLLDQIAKGEEQTRRLERDRISRELHDTIGYTLMNIIAVLKASVELSRKDGDKTREFLEQGIGQAQKGLAETRQALREMRSTAEDRVSIVRTINRLAEAFKETHIRVTAHFSNIPWLFGDQVDSIVYRIVQEGITNAIRHGNASQIAIHLAVDAGRVIVTINDNGCGAASIADGIGLTGIRERLHEVQGDMSAENIRGGFRLFARIPFGGDS
jgi:signal transduction histidine kinase